MIEVMQCDNLTTIQDLGRFGRRHLGIGQAGAMDNIALQQANLLLGNTRGAAGLEISLGALQLRFHQARDVAWSGTDFPASLLDTDGQPASKRLSPGYVHHVPAGMILRLQRPPMPGMRCFLAVAGGLDVPEVMGSHSTDIASGFGGFRGRPLQRGDRLSLGEDTGRPVSGRYGVRPLSPEPLLRVLPGPDYELFEAGARDALWQDEWRVTPDSNRMGLRLEGSNLWLSEPGERQSAAVLPGVVQVPPNGQPIVLANDAQTTGGYPCIVSVISADLWKLAYLPPGSRVRFAPVEVEEALAIAAEAREYMRQLQYRLDSRRKGGCHAD